MGIIRRVEEGGARQGSYRLDADDAQRLAKRMNNISPNQLDGARIEIYDTTPVDAWVKAGVVINGMALGVAAVAIYVVRPR